MDADVGVISALAAPTVTIAQGNLRRGSLDGHVVIVTGAGGGIGFEAARSLLWLGAAVAIAEVDERKCTDAEAALAAEWPGGQMFCQPTDVGVEASVERLVHQVEARFGHVDAVINNATCALAGMAVAEAPISAWDRSYAVNLRGPVLLARACLPGMVARGHGAFLCVSSTGGPFLASYETLKAAQVALAASLDAELQGTGVIAFTIGPGLVPTATATEAISSLAPRLGMTVEEFWAMNRGAVLSVEAAGAGFAAAVALADRYAGQEISSTQALVDAGIAVPDAELPAAPRAPAADTAAALQACRGVSATLKEQVAGWKERSFFERQWMQRDFKQRVGVPAERCIELLAAIERRLAEGDVGALRSAVPTLDKLRSFYGHMGDLALGYIKDLAQRDEQVAIVKGWAGEVERLLDHLPEATPSTTNI